MEYTVNYKNIVNLRVFDHQEELALSFVEKLLDRMLEISSGGGYFSVALSGGSTPLIIYKYLSRVSDKHLNWNRVLIYWGDERCVSPDHPESNYGNAWDTLLTKIPIPPGNIHRMKGEGIPSEEAVRYTKELKKLELREGYPVIDLILLGIGEDGHTASIFPDQMELLNTGEWVSPAIHPTSGQKRITLTGKVLNNAKEVLFLATGSGKKKVISQIINDEPAAQGYPAYHIRPTRGDLTWFVDRKALDE